MNYQLLALDIDGTLTNSKKEITPATLEALLQMQRNPKGARIVLASGRPLHGMLAIAKQLQLERYGGYILAFNGALVVNCQTQEVITQVCLPQEMIGQIYDRARAYGVQILTYDGDCVIAEDVRNSYVRLEASINQIAVRQVASFRDYVTFPVPKCLLVGDGTYLARVEKELQKEIGDRVSVYRSEPYFLELMPKGIDKANALRALLSHLGLSREHLIACGDGFNDISMITYAGLGVAMKNAQDPVKEAADFITLSNEEDGIVSVLEKYMKDVF